MTDLKPLFVSIINAGKLLGIGRSAIYLLLDGKQLTSVKIGKRRLISRKSIDDFAASLTTIN
jgi:excisionase family DNA binding protein